MVGGVKLGRCGHCAGARLGHSWATLQTIVGTWMPRESSVVYFEFATRQVSQRGLAQASLSTTAA